MGNVSTRKRQQVEATDEPLRKRRRLITEEIEPPKQTKPLLGVLKRHARQKIKNKTDESFVYRDKRAFSDESPYLNEAVIPWFDVLFLPEFPTRSSITEHSFLIETELGHGSFGVVYLASAIYDEEKKFAIKMQKKSEIVRKQAVQQVKREASIQRSLPSHPFVSRTYFTWQTTTHIYSLLQYPQGNIGDLFTVWKDRGSLSESAIRLIGAEIASAIDFLHRNDVIYRDVKLENVVLDYNGHVLLIDFGLAKKLKNGDCTSTICGTLQYMSPDVASGKPYSHYVDWWSLGVLLHILLTGIYPYPNSEVTHHNDLKFVEYNTPIGCSHDFSNLMDRMLAIPKSKRLCSFTVLHAHSFFRSVDFESLEQKKYVPITEMATNEYDEANDDRVYQDDCQNSDILDFNFFDEDYTFYGFNDNNTLE